jgi:predicted nucleic-acid-binding protein
VNLSCGAVKSKPFRARKTSAATAPTLLFHSIRYNSHREFVDFPDIVNLIDANGINVNSADFITLCKKIGTDELYEKIRAHFSR